MPRLPVVVHCNRVKSHRKLRPLIDFPRSLCERGGRALSPGGKSVKKLLRFYALASLVAVLISACLLFYCVRAVSIASTIEIAERDNLALTRTALTLVKPDLVDFLAAAKDIRPGRPPADEIPPLPGQLSSALNQMLVIPAVARMKIYNAGGVVVFSSDHDQIGESQESNGGYNSAMKGKAVSTLTYRDALNPFDKATKNDNLIQTYVPVRDSPTEPILGVLGIYTDGNPVIARNEEAGLYILFGLAAIVTALYVTLLFLVRRVTRVIEQQQEQAIRMRTATMELRSAQMLSAEEEEKRSIALELREGVAQTLCLVKVRLEHRLDYIEREGLDSAPVQQIIRVLQSAIEDVRMLAGNLRPPSLDELGLLPTIEWFCASFERLHPEVSIEKGVDVAENDTPLPLKIVIYRIIESTLPIFARSAGRSDVRLDLRRAGERIELEIEDTPRDSRYPATWLGQDANLQLRFAKIKERITLLGGTFALRPNAAGGVALRASWLRAPLDAPPRYDADRNSDSGGPHLSRIS